MKLTSIAMTHIGRRANNEDAYLAESDLGLYAVADGMGGYEGGEVASALAVATVEFFVRNNNTDGDVTWPHALESDLTFDQNLVKVAARLAHDRIAQRRVGELSKMGSTISLLMARGSHATIANVGDSRVYRWRDGVLEQLTTDHSLYAELLASGAEDLPDEDDFPYSNVITRALGISGEADVVDVELRDGDRYLLCTDGLSEKVSAQEIGTVLATQSLRQAGETLVARAYELGGADNITLVLVQCSN